MQFRRSVSSKRKLYPVAAAYVIRRSGLFCVLGASLAYGTAALGQATSGQATSQPTPPTPSPTAPSATATLASAPAVSTDTASSSSKVGGREITEDELRSRLVGKPLFLREGYLGDSLSFTEHGDPTGHPIRGSYALSAVEIDKVRLTKHKVELTGLRYGLHYLADVAIADPNGDSSNNVDRIRMTPRKKMLKITIDRELVVKPKVPKDKSKGKYGADAAAPAVTSSASDVASAPALTAESPAQTPAEPASEQAADPASVTTTTSPAHAAAMLRSALDKIFAEGLDAQLQSQMPEFWQLYFKARAAGVEFHSTDPNVLHPSAVDQQARVLTSIAPDSNEYAQASGISGRALYRAVVGADGKPTEIAVVRPIGFGLDEKAVEAIQKATFQPALKGGQPVAESLDLAVVFRIYSKRTAVAAADAKSAQSGPVKPGPYTVRAQQSPPPPQQ